MKKFYTTEKIPTDCRGCMYYHEHNEQTCGLCNDHMQHFRVERDNPWDDDEVVDCPLCSLQEHDRQLLENLTNYILDRDREKGGK